MLQQAKGPQGQVRIHTGKQQQYSVRARIRGSGLARDGIEKAASPWAQPLTYQHLLC